MNFCVVLFSYVLERMITFFEKTKFFVFCFFTENRNRSTFYCRPVSVEFACTLGTSGKG